MTLSRWDPFEDLTRIQERMNRMFEDSLGRTRGDLSGETGRWVPAVDIYETPERVVLLADLPGVEQDDIELRIENNTLVLSGERRMKKDVNHENYHRVERGHGTFHRSFTLPTTIDQHAVRAEHRQGILEVSLPKTEGARPKKIPVDVRS
ncbi:MAG: Hsp20/alpha crystallin family protein [Acidobacteriota bacterium]